MALATLSVDLVAKMATFQADLGKAARESERTAQRISAAFGGIKTAAAGLVGAISLGGIAALAKQAIDSVDALNDLKDATGASIENLSALEDVAARTGTSFDAVGSGLVKFNSALKDAKPGSDTEAAFKALNLSLAELKSLDPAEALRQTAVALAQFADDGNKARLVQELFGKSVREVGPFLKDLAEQGSLVAKVTTEQAQEAEKFNKELFNLQKNAQDAARALVGDLVTGINKAAAALRESGLLASVKTLLFGDEGHQRNVRLVELTDQLLQAESGLQKQRAAGFGDDSRYVKGSLARIDAIKKEIGSIQALRNADNPDNFNARDKLLLRRPSVDFAGAIKPTASRAARAIVAPKEEITDAQRALASYVDGLQRAIERTQDLSAEQEALNFLRTLGATGEQEQVRTLVLGMSRQIDEARRLKGEKEALLEIDKSIAEQEQAAADARESRIARLLEPTQTERLARERDDMVFLTDLFERGRIGETQYLEAVTARLGITNERMEKTKTLAEELGLTFSSAFEDAIVGGKGFSQVLKGLEQDIMRIVTRKLVTEPLGNAISGAIGGAGGIGGFFSGLFGKLFGSFDGGGYTGSGPRIGGLDGRGGRLAVLHPQETVVDHTRGQRIGNSVSIVINQSFSPGTSRATTMQAAADARRQLEFAGRNL